MGRLSSSFRAGTMTDTSRPLREGRVGQGGSVAGQADEGEKRGRPRQGGPEGGQGRHGTYRLRVTAASSPSSCSSWRLTSSASTAVPGLGTPFCAKMVATSASVYPTTMTPIPLS